MVEQRSKSNSIQAQVAMRQEAKTGLDWPSTVTPLPDHAEHAKVLEIYAELLEARPPSLWKRADILALANLAISMRQLDRANQLLEKSGFLIRGNGKNGPGTGGLIQNPMLIVVQQLAARIESTTRRLQLGAIGADPKTVTNSRLEFNAAGGSTFKPKLATKDGEAAPDWAKIAGLAE